MLTICYTPRHDLFFLSINSYSSISATIVSSLSNLEGEEVFEASSLGHCDYVGQERISDDELIIIKGTFVIFRLTNLIIMFRTKSTIIRINHCPWCKLFHV